LVSRKGFLIKEREPKRKKKTEMENVRIGKIEKAFTPVSYREEIIRKAVSL